MEVSNKLMNEHQLILQYIEFTKKIVGAENTEIKNVFIQEYGYKLIEFIQEYSDKYHHSKEEEILFRYMEMPGVLTHCNPLSQMRYEHEQGRECVREMIASLECDDFKLFCENASAYAILLSEHIYKEDNVLYPMAEQGLTHDQKVEIQKEYAKVEEKFNDKINFDQFYRDELQELLNKLKTSGVING